MKRIFLVLIIFFFSSMLRAQQKYQLSYDVKKQFQTIHSFGTTDCWTIQRVGVDFPIAVKERLADYLFSREFDEAGNPIGIGMSIWRFNLGTGSVDIGDRSGIHNWWGRRSECFMDSTRNWDWSKQEGQRWFLDAARKRGVEYTLAFSIAVPWFMSKNGMARASDESEFANIREDQYDDFAYYMAEVCKKFKIDYLSPINEPQWGWNVKRQEGMQANNEECAKLIRCLDKELKGSKTKVVFGEAADIRYLYRHFENKTNRDNQIEELYSATGKHSISNLKCVAPIISGHSYWSTWPMDTLIGTREHLKEKMKSVIPHYAYWQTEFFPMEENPENNKRTGNGIDYALYVARVIHHDLVVCNTASWQWWTSIGGMGKDALIGVSDLQGKSESYNIVAHKNFWALGNYSRFIRPGMIRIGRSDGADYSVTQTSDLMSSAYWDEKSKQVVFVLINYSDNEKKLSLSIDNLDKRKSPKQYKVYETSKYKSLNYSGVSTSDYTIPPRSIVTLVSF